MTLEELRAKVIKWDLEIPAHSQGVPAASEFGMILNRLEHHAERDWRVYLPAQHPDYNPSYMERLAAWIGNVPAEDDQKLLLRYASYISFFSHEDFSALYLAAMEREIKRWVAQQLSIGMTSFQADILQSSVRKEVHDHTWFCPVTDSMDINEFYKVNHLKGIGHRPAFSTLQMLAEKAGDSSDKGLAERVSRYMANPSFATSAPSRALERIVLLEDIVGSATQCIEAVRWAVEALNKPVLFVPLILCPQGVSALHKEEVKSNGRLSVRPIITLQADDLLGPARGTHGGWGIAPEVESLALRVRPRLGLNEAFGYKKTGCSISTFSNTPDNSLPIIHHKPRNGQWHPLFPRVYRD